MIVDNGQQCYGGGGNGGMEAGYAAENAGGGSYYASSSLYHPTPSPADSGVMSPMTPMSSYTTGSLTSPEHLGSSGAASSFPLSASCSPYSHPSPADSGFGNCIPSPYPMTSPGGSTNGMNNQTLAEQERCCVVQNQYEQWQQPIQQTANNVAHVASGYRPILPKPGPGHDGAMHSKNASGDVTQNIPDQIGHVGKDAPPFTDIGDDELNALLEDALSGPGEFEGGEDREDEDEDEDVSKETSEEEDEEESSFPAKQSRNSSDVSEAINRMGLAAGSHQRKWGGSSIGNRPHQNTQQNSNLASPISPSSYSTGKSNSTKNSGKRKKNRASGSSSNKTPSSASSASPMVTAGTTMASHNPLPSGSAMSQQQYRLPSNCQIQQQSMMASTSNSGDMDQLYMNSASNVSPDSGIQSEGVASSPLHLGADGLPMANSNGLVISNSAVLQHQQGLHPAFHGASYTTGHHHHLQQAQQQQQQFAQNMWNTMQSSQQPGNFYGQFMQHQGHQPQGFSMATSASNFQYHNNPMTLITAPGSNHRLMQPHLPQHHNQTVSQQQPQQSSHHRRTEGENDTPPPVLLPSVSPTSSHSSGGGKASIAAPSSKSDKSKRGRGRPRGSKNKVKKVTMECGSQTEESILEPRYSTDSDTSGGSLPPPLPKFMASASTSSTLTSGGSRGRPRKDPPMLEPQITPSTSFKSKKSKHSCDRSVSSSAKVSVGSSSKAVGPSRKTKSRKDFEVIVLDSDDDDEEETSESEEDEDDEVYVEYTRKKSSYREESERKATANEKLKRSKKRMEEIQAEQRKKAEIIEKIHNVSKFAERQKSKPAQKVNTVTAHRSITPKSERDSSHSPVRITQPSRFRMSRQDIFLKDSYLAANTFGRKPFSSNFSFNNGEVQPIFDTKFKTRQPDRFWRSPSLTKSEANSTSAIEDDPRRSSSAESSRVLTKASLKELSSFPVASPFGMSGGASTKTMLSVLAETNKKAKPGRKKRGRKKQSSSEWAEVSKSAKGHQVVSPGSSCHSSKSPFSPRSNISNEPIMRDVKYSELLDYSEGYKNSSSKGKKKKKDKSWRSKHKNVIDPVFLSEVEHLIQDMASCQIEAKLSTDIWQDRPHDSVPSIFRKRKILSKNKRDERQRKSRSKRPSKDADVHPNSSGKEIQKQQSSPTFASVAATAFEQPSDSAEQRLPLKKRHHHQIPKQQPDDSESGHSSSSCALSPPLPSPSSLKGRTASPILYSGKSTKPSLHQNAEMQNKSSLSRKQKPPLPPTDISIIHELGTSKSPSSTAAPRKQPTAADRMVEKMGIQNLLPRSAARERSGSKSTIKMLEENSERILGKYTGAPESKRISVLQSLSPSKPLPPTTQGSAGPVNYVSSMAACIDKYTANGKLSTSSMPNEIPVPASKGAKNLTSPLSVETSPSPLAKTPASLKSPRKRHLLELQRQNKLKEEANQSVRPPNLEKASFSDTASGSSTLLDSQTRTSPPLLATTEGSYKSQQDPKCSPPNLSPPHTEEASVDQLQNDTGVMSGDETIGPSKVSSEDDKPLRPKKKSKLASKKRKKRRQQQETTKYSDISEDERPPLSSLKITLKRDRPSKDSTSEEDPFTQLQKSASTKPIKMAPSSTVVVNPSSDNASSPEHPSSRLSPPTLSIEEDDKNDHRPMSPLKMPLTEHSSSEAEEHRAQHQKNSKKAKTSAKSLLSKERLTERQRKLIEAKEATKEIVVPVKEEQPAPLPPPIKRPRGRPPKIAPAPIPEIPIPVLAAAPAAEATSNEKASSLPFASDDDGSASDPDQKVIKPKILKSFSKSPSPEVRPVPSSPPRLEAWSEETPSSVTLSPRSEEKRLTLQKCTVRVQKLTEQEIIESSPSPPNLAVNSDEEQQQQQAEEKQTKRKICVPKQTSPKHQKEEEESEPPNSQAQEGEDLVDSKPFVPSILKKRKRRSNKTGFPSIKKKKRAQSSSQSPASDVRVKKRATSSSSSSLVRTEEAKPVRTSQRKQDQAEREESKDVLSRALQQLEEEGQRQSAKRKAPEETLPAKPKDSEETKMKRPRGRPPKKRVTANSSFSCRRDAEFDSPDRSSFLSSSLKSPSAPSKPDSSLQSRDSSLTNSLQGSEDLLPMNPGVPMPLMRSASSDSLTKRSSRLYEDIDDEIDCLSLLPPLGMESGQSSEAPSGTETEDNGSRSSSVSKSKRKKTALFKKSSLKAGLFADSYKEKEDLGKGPEQPATTKKQLAYYPDDHPHGLLPPPYYCGRQLRQKREDFQLPYDLWWLHANKQLPGRDVAATWNYRKIKNNIYYDIKPVAKFDENQACHCQPNSGCGDDCINRMTYIECDSRTCPAGDTCANNAIQRHRAVTGLERFMTEEGKGWGIRTKQSVNAGDFIMEYVGEVVSEREFKHRMSHQYVEDTHHYCLHLDGGIVIDGHRVGGECRFVNHACEPNCEIQKWTVNGIYRMALFSKRNIKPGEELTYDYNFSLFNPHEGQSCRCGSTNCRGVIGGRSQRINSNEEGSQSRASSQDRNGSRDRKKLKAAKGKKASEGSTLARMPLLAPMKPMSAQQQDFVRRHQCFLNRNWEKVRRIRESLQKKVNGHIAQRKEETASRPEDMILTGLTALTTARSMKTRRLTIAQDNPNVNKVIQLAQLLKEIFAQVTTLEDETGHSLSRFFTNLPSKKKQPQYFIQIPEPIDFSSVDRNINTGFYSGAEPFDRDVLRLCQNNLRFYGRNSQEGKAILEIRKKYNEIKQLYHSAVEEIVGELGAAAFKKREELPQEDEAIRCLCGQFNDEGMMVQCERCLVWQHCDCVGHTPKEEEEEKYFCEVCGEREVKLDVELSPQPDFASPGETYYNALARDDLQVSLHETVYVLRAFKENDKADQKAKKQKCEEAVEEAKVNGETKPEEEKMETCEGKELETTVPPTPESPTVSKDQDIGGIPHKMMSPFKGPSLEASSLTKGNYPTYKTVDPNISTMDMDIFRIERLWVDDKGNRFAFGHHYLRPHETFHEPSRKFFHNEVFRVPIYEVLPLDTIWGKCTVLDLPTFCSGRPVDAVEEHVYICEFRVDKSARLFKRISKPKFPVCQKWFAFDQFDQKLKPQRTYMPHEVPHEWIRSSSTPRSRSLDDPEHRSREQSAAKKGPKPSKGGQLMAAAKIGKKKDRHVQKNKLDSTLLKLLGKLPGKNVVDASYLLESDKRLRKKHITHNNPNLT